MDEAIEEHENAERRCENGSKEDDAVEATKKEEELTALPSCHCALHMRVERRWILFLFAFGCTSLVAGVVYGWPALRRQLQEDGIRELDRQVFGFSTDEVYEWLMDTPAQSAVIEEKLKKRDDPDLAIYLYESVTTNEEEARSLRDKRREILKDLGYDKSGEI